MNDIQLNTAVESGVVLAALLYLKKGEITEVIACFAKRFEFTDRGLGLQFNNLRRLAEFFRKSRELNPDSSLETEKIILCGEYVIIEWTARTTLKEPFYGGLTRHAPVVLRGGLNRRSSIWEDHRMDGLL